MKRKLFFILLLSFIYINCCNCFAVTEKFTETELVNFGNGIVVPSRFDVLNDDGSYTFIPRMSTFLGNTENEYGKDNTILLEYDYTATRKFNNGNASKGILAHGQISIDDENKNQVFYLGRDAQNKLMCGLCDGDGNYSVYYYDESEISKDNDDEYYLADSLIIYNNKDKYKKIYSVEDEKMHLISKYDYSEEDDCVVTEYFKHDITQDNLDEDDISFEKFNYRQRNLDTVMLNYPEFSYDSDKDEYSYKIKGQEFNLPLAINIQGKDKYLRVIKHKSSDWLKEAYRPENEYDTALFFTASELETLDKENLVYYEDIYEKHKDFLFDFAFLNSSEAQTDEDAKYFIEDENVLVQALTGNVAIINGSVPAKLETKWEKTDNGEQIRLSLVDKDRNILAGMISWSDDHTKYKYVKIVSLMNITDSDYVFEIVGTDVPTKGEKNNYGSEIEINQDAFIDAELYEKEGFKIH